MTAGWWRSARSRADSNATSKWSIVGGESLYAFLGSIMVDSGQSIARRTPLARPIQREEAPALHFGIRDDAV